MLKAGIVTGVLVLTNDHRKDAFSASSSQLLQLLCTHASLSIDNAKLCSRMLAQNQTLEEQNLQLQQSKEAAEKAALAKAEFLSAMSHEVRTPLNAMLGVSRLLESTELSMEQCQYISMINNSGRMLLSIVNDILDYSKMEAGKVDIVLDPYNLADVIESLAFQCYGNAIAKNLTLTWYLDPAIPPVLLVDSARLQQVLLNLLSNAIKFTKQGSVRLSVIGRWMDPGGAEGDSDTGTPGSLRPSDSTTPEVALRSLHRMEVRFEVCDTGIGISEEQLVKLFRPFSQVRHSSGEYGGTGLGLVISERLVAAMGGHKVEVDSEPGRGSTFSFRIVCHLPATSCSAQDVQSRPSQEKSSAGVITSVTTTLLPQTDIYHMSPAQLARLRHLQCVFIGDLTTCECRVRLLTAYGCAVRQFPSLDSAFEHVHFKATQLRSQNMAPDALEEALRSIADVFVVDLDASYLHEDEVLEKLALFSPVRLLFLYSHPHLLQMPSSGGTANGTSTSIPSTPQHQSSVVLPTQSPSLSTPLHSAAGGVQHFPHVPRSHVVATATALFGAVRDYASLSIREDLAKPCKGTAFLQAVCTLAAESFRHPATSRPSVSPSATPASGSACSSSTSEWPSPVVDHGSLSPSKRSRELRREIPKLAMGCPLRILLAEDNLINQKMMVMLLRKLGYEILVAANGVEALELLDREAARGRSHEIECVLMDASMDTMDGFECTRVIRAHQMPHRVRPYIIAQTANVTDEYRQRCKDSGMDLFLPKPIQLQRLMASLQAAYAAHHEAAAADATASSDSPIDTLPDRPETSRESTSNAH